MRRWLASGMLAVPLLFAASGCSLLLAGESFSTRSDTDPNDIQPGQRAVGSADDNAVVSVPPP